MGRDGEGRRDSRSEDRNGRFEARRTNSRRLTDRDIDERLSRVQSYGTGRNRTEVNRSGRRGNAPMRAGNSQQRNLITASPERPAVSSSTTGRAQPRSNAERRRRQSNPRPKRTSPPTRRISRGDLKQRIKKNFFPDGGYGGRSVVSSRSVDCAREDKLRVFIPNERLDAARFDGLTLIAFDAQGGEAPIYLPPNYIEGYRLAASGQVRPQGISSAPQYAAPPVSLPPQTIEAAPCPAGTTKQANGTCLQVGGTFGYPTR